MPRKLFHCKSAEHWQTSVVGSKGDKYTVSYKKLFSDAMMIIHECTYDYSCSCPANSSFKTKEYCKHIKQVMSNHCRWMQYSNGGEPIQADDQLRCPSCSGEVSSQIYLNSYFNEDLNDSK